MTLVGYLESVSDGLTIDLITVANYEVGDTSVMVPQRVDPEKTDRGEASGAAEHRSGQGTTTPGADAFVAAITELDPEDRPALRRLAASGHASSRARDSAGSRLIRAWAPTVYTLLPRLQPDNAGLITVWNDHGIASMQFWRSVFERRAPGPSPRSPAATAMMLYDKATRLPSLTTSC